MTCFGCAKRSTGKQPLHHAFIFAGHIFAQPTKILFHQAVQQQPCLVHEELGRSPWTFETQQSTQLFTSKCGAAPHYFVGSSRCLLRCRISLGVTMTLIIPSSSAGSKRSAPNLKLFLSMVRFTLQKDSQHHNMTPRTWVDTCL